MGIMILVLFVAIGFGAAYWIARNLSGAKGWLALAGWFLVPFVLFAAWTIYDLQQMHARSTDYDQAVPLLILYSLVMAVPWGVANLVGALTGRQKRRRDAAPGGQVF